MVVLAGIVFIVLATLYYTIIPYIGDKMDTLDLVKKSNKVHCNKLNKAKQYKPKSIFS